MKSVRHSRWNNWFMLKFTWQYAPTFVIAEILRGILYGINNSAIVIFTRVFYGYLEENAPFSTAALVICMMMVYLLVFHALDKSYNHIFAPIQKEKIHMGMQSFLFKKARTLDLELYDTPQFYDDFIWSMRQCDTQAISLIKSISDFITYVTALLATFTVMASVSTTMAILAILCAVLSIIMNRIEMKINYQQDMQLNPLERKSEYLERIFSTPDYAKEVRISHIAELNENKYMENLNDIRQTNVAFNRKLLFFTIYNNVSGIVMQSFIYMILSYQALIKNNMSIAGIAVAFSAFWSLWSFLEEIITLIIDFPKHSMYIEKLRIFLDLEPKIKHGHCKTPAFESLTMKNVTFGYQADKPVLRNIDFTINRGEKIAIVGYNGAGKSTFIKLLLHLYHPQSDEITYNGQDISTFEKESYLERIGVVLQDYKIFAATIAENVLCSKFTQDKTTDILSALTKATFLDVLNQLDKGIQSELTREFSNEGIQLSGGEAQKLAIARAFVHTYDLLILDEPSSALDPIAESELTRSILGASKDITALFISHRLSTTRLADRIYMFEDGQIIEAGTHDQLMQASGKYAEMFNVQAEKYLLH